MQTVMTRPGDPRIYLRARDGEWFYYDPNLECLGSGAMGTVYLGFGLQTGRRIAIKRVKDQYANQYMIRERAKQEASLVFNHPNIIQMLGYCECHPSRGPIFILSEYVSGVTLEHHARTQMAHLDVREKSKRIALEICHILDALSCIHSYGIVHRDIKPSNIMLEGGKNVKLMDLGIARLNGGNKFSTVGFIGTPQYASPEQIMRESASDDIDLRSDIYALGITLYVLIAGFNPFDSNVQMDILENQLRRKLPYSEKIDRPLFYIISKATEKNPDRRYQSAMEFKDALTEYINSEPPPPFPTGLVVSVVVSLIVIAVIVYVFLMLM